MAAHDEAFGFRSLGVAALQCFAQDLLVQRGGETDHVERDQGFAAHGVHVGKGVGRRYGAIFVWVIGYRREESRP